jgi:glyoxylase-like metal-dependent hydrolase (beta-lactamase superfamily II)
VRSAVHAHDRRMASFSLEFIELTDWLWCLRSRVVACFAIRDRDGVVMIDANVAGLGEPIVEALAHRLDVPSGSVALRQVLLTHAHADHYGSASELARLTGAELLGPAKEADILCWPRATGRTGALRVGTSHLRAGHAAR